MNRKGETSMLTYGLISLVAVALAATGGYAAYQAGVDQASVTEQVTEGEFDQVGLDHADLESPFQNLNGFQSITVDSDASAGTADVMDQAVFEWAVAGGQDLGLEERSSVQFVETDGALDDVEIEYQDQGATGVQIQDVAFYDYEAAVDGNNLDNNEVGADFEVDGMDAEAELGNLADGEYASVITYKWDSGESAPAAGTTNVLNHLEMDATTDGDVDAVSGVHVQTTTQ